MCFNMPKFGVKIAIMSSKIVIFGKIIRERRKSLRIDQREMSKIMGIGLRTYQRKEAGYLSVSELETICKVLNLSMVLIPNECIS